MSDQLETGVIVEVSEQTFGGELDQDAPIGSTQLVLIDADDFNEDGGQLVIINDDEQTEVVGYLSADLEEGVVTLATPTISTHVAGEQVEILPQAVERIAQVALDTDGETINARVPHALFDRIGEGIRDEETEQRCTLELDGAEWVVVDVLGSQPSIDGSFVDLSEVDLPGQSDGEPPEEATQLSFIGGIGALFYRWSEIENADPVLYRLHVAEAETPPIDGSHMVASGLGLTAAAVRQLADGSTIIGDGSVTYHAVVTVHDADGDGPTSNEVTGVPVKTPTSEELAAIRALVDANSAAVSAAQSAVDAAQADVDAVETQVADALTSIGSLRGDLDTTQSDVAAAQAAVAVAQSDVDAVETQVADALASIDSLSGDLDATQIDVAAVQSDVASALSAIDTAEADIAAAQAQIAATQSELDDVLPIDGTKITDGAISTEKLAANAVIADKIAANAVTATQIATDAVTAAKISANAVVAGKIAANAVTANTIAADAVTAAKIAADAVTAAKIAAGAVEAEQIKAGAVVAGKIAADAVTATQIAADAVTTAKLAANAVVAGKIAADAVTATQIAAGAVEAEQIAAGAVVAGKIAADAVTAATIKAGAVIAGKIAADAVTATTIAGEAVTAAKIAAGAIETEKIASGAITTDKLDANAITANLLQANDAIIDVLNTTDLSAVTLTGARFQTAASGDRLVIDQETSGGLISFYSGDPLERQQGMIDADRIGGGTSSVVPRLQIISGRVQAASNSLAHIDIEGAAADNSRSSQIRLRAEKVSSPAPGDEGGQVVFQTDIVSAQQATCRLGTVEIARANDEFTPPTKWAELNIAAGWAAVVSQLPMFKRDAAGNVHLRGALTRSSGTNGSRIATLPVGFRPDQNVYRVVRGSNSVSVVQLIIATDGQMIVTWTGGSNPVSCGIDCTFTVMP